MKYIVLYILCGSSLVLVSDYLLSKKKKKRKGKEKGEKKTLQHITKKVLYDIKFLLIDYHLLIYECIWNEIN